LVSGRQLAGVTRAIRCVIVSRRDEIVSQRVGVVSLRDRSPSVLGMLVSKRDEIVSWRVEVVSRRVEDADELEIQGETLAPVARGLQTERAFLVRDAGAVGIEDVLLGEEACAMGIDGVTLVKVCVFGTRGRAGMACVSSFATHASPASPLPPGAALARAGSSPPGATAASRLADVPAASAVVVVESGRNRGEPLANSGDAGVARVLRDPSAAPRSAASGREAAHHDVPRNCAGGVGRAGPA
jgi:hypothetical protein